MMSMLPITRNNMVIGATTTAAEETITVGKDAIGTDLFIHRKFPKNKNCHNHKDIRFISGHLAAEYYLLDAIEIFYNIIGKFI